MLGLVIPCFRESRRLPGFLPDLLAQIAEAIQQGSLHPQCVVQLIDDGSGAEEATCLAHLVQTWQATYPDILRPALILPQNLGKGGAVYAGWDALKHDCGMLAFVDADGAVDAEETRRFLECASQLACITPQTALFASRLGPQRVQRHWLRQLVGLVFRACVHVAFHLPIRDTQCGLKAVSSASYRVIRPLLKREDFAFDIELALQLQRAGCQLNEEPVRWTEIPGSHLRPGHAFRMFAALISLRASSQ